MNFKEYLAEAPVAKKGDWSYETTTWFALGDISARYIKEKYKLLGKHRDLEIYMIELMTKERIYIAGDFQTGLDPDFPEKERFKIVSKLHLTKSRKKLPGYKNVYEVDGVGVDPSYRGTGIATAIYKSVVKDGVTILSDNTQYFGARRLWSNLSKMPQFTVDVIDTKSKEVLEKDVKLSYEEIEGEFDKKYWSSNTDKQNIQFILNKIK